MVLKLVLNKSKITPVGVAHAHPHLAGCTYVRNLSVTFFYLMADSQ